MSEPVIRSIPLSQLELSPANVRRTPAPQTAFDELKASIAAHGLLENLIVRCLGPGPEGIGRYAVIAGGRRLTALVDLARNGVFSTDYPVPCLVIDNAARENELSLAENVVRVAMHPADQVEAFGALAETGTSVADIAARFGVSEHTVEQRLRLGNAAPELLDAYRAEKINLETLKAFAVTTDHARQRAVWEEVSNQGYRPTAWQVKHTLTEDQVQASGGIARYVGVDAYENAGGTVTRDLFADEEDHGVWFDDVEILHKLAAAKLNATASDLQSDWKWVETHLEVDWATTARHGRVNPKPGQLTDDEHAESQRLMQRHDELVTLDDDDWTDALMEEGQTIEARLDQLETITESRAVYSPEQRALAGCVVTIDHNGNHRVIKGLVRPDDIPASSGTTPDNDSEDDKDNALIPSITQPLVSPADPSRKAREDAGVGIGLADDLRSIRTALVKAHLASNFEAAFDLLLFQLGRAVFTRGYRAHALDIAVTETTDRPGTRTNDEGFANWSPGEAMLADRSHLPFEWMEQDDDAASFAALRVLPQAEKQTLFAAAVARTVNGQLAFEHGSRPELEATVARLDIDFASHVRPTADMLWSRIRKDRILAVAGETLGPAWASARAKYKKTELAKAMEAAFAAGDPPPGLDASAHAAALTWSPPGFAPFDAGGGNDPDPATQASTVHEPTDTADGPGNGEKGGAPKDNPRTTSTVERINSSTAATRKAEPPEDNAESVPAPEPGQGQAPEGPANSYDHIPPTDAEGEGSPAPMNGPEGTEDASADPTIAHAIDAMNAVPTADGGPRVIVQTVGPVNGHDAGDDLLDIPEFLRRVH